MCCFHDSPQCQCAYYYQGFTAVCRGPHEWWDILFGGERVDSAPTRQEAIAVIRGDRRTKTRDASPSNK